MRKCVVMRIPLLVFWIHTSHKSTLGDSSSGSSNRAVSIFPNCEMYSLFESWISMASQLSWKSQTWRRCQRRCGSCRARCRSIKNAGMSAEMLSCSRAHGVFGGLSLSGTSLGPDSAANEKIYGKKVNGQNILSGSVQAPDSAQLMLSILQEKSPTNAFRGKS